MIAPGVPSRGRKLMTFSIVARDLQTSEWGVAVQSKFVAIGALTPWAKADVGAIATQAWINTTYGTRGLELLARGLSPTATIAHLTGEDEGRAHRQVGMIGIRGEAATYTGEACPPWAGGLVGRNYACQGNFMIGDAPI